MDAIYWYLIIGTTLLGVAVAASLLKHLPVSTAIIYLLLGLALGPHGIGLLSWDVVNHAHLFERLSEVAVIVSLFTVGLNMRHVRIDFDLDVARFIFMLRPVALFVHRFL